MLCLLMLQVFHNKTLFIHTNDMQGEEHFLVSPKVFTSAINGETDIWILVQKTLNWVGFEQPKKIN